MNTIADDNLESLIILLKARLNSTGQTTSKDSNGNTVYVDCDIYSKHTLSSFISLSISEFNQTPSFTNFGLDNTLFVKTFSEILVEGATLYALSSKALLEKGREFVVEDGGISFVPPSVAEMLNTQFSTLLTHHWDKLKTIKSRIKEF